MKDDIAASLPVSLFIPQSSASTSVNKTGTWSFMRPRYLEKTAPCSARCPCGQDIPRVEMLVSRRRFDVAWATLLSENPMPGTCGRVCFHPCESACNRGEFDSPVSINSLERFIDDAEGAGAIPEALLGKSPKGRSVAIAGSGPAGLSAAWFLARLGYDCEIFEAECRPGGVLRSGIPSYRLPEAVLDREIARIQALGVKIHCSKRIGPDFLKAAKSRYAAVFISCGHGKSTSLGIPGGEFAADGLAFLARTKNAGGKGTQAVGGAAGKSAIVIGGGNTAVDVSRSLLREGIAPTIVYRRRREDMPAFGQEIERALEEGVGIVELSAPVSIARAGQGFVLTVQKMRASGLGSDGRMKVSPIPGEVDAIVAGSVYSAVGASPGEPWMIPADRTQVHRMSRCAAVWRSEAGIPLLYGGDLVVEEESVADAIGSGKEAAIALDAYFTAGETFADAEIARCRIGDGTALSMDLYLGGIRSDRSGRVVKFKDINTDYFSASDRERGPSRPAQASIHSFAEIESSLDEGKALEQAERCFNCGICNDCDNCRTFCPEVAVSAARAGRDDWSAEAGPGRTVNADYCKGCGVCVTECPRGAMIIEEQQP